MSWDEEVNNYNCAEKKAVSYLLLFPSLANSSMLDVVATLKSWLLCTGAKSNLKDRVLGEIEKNTVALLLF